MMGVCGCSCCHPLFIVGVVMVMNGVGGDV